MSQTVILSSPYNRRLAHTLVERAPVGAVVQVKAASRTNDQNARMWAMLSDISRAKPLGRIHNAETWKAIMMEMAGFKPKFVPSIDGNSVIVTGYKSSRLTKQEFSDLIEAMYAFGAEHGVVWSEPEGIAA